LKVLLDTCTFLWIISDSPELSETAGRLFIDPNNEILLSVASVWEIIVKHRLGKLPLPEPPRKFISKWRARHNIESLSLDESSVLHLAGLPEYHKDPFDRILICQAISNSLTILTPDAHIAAYPVRTEW
jgi:PIN domain nuclease of toxin-antitoxin system